MDDLATIRMISSQLDFLWVAEHRRSDLTGGKPLSAYREYGKWIDLISACVRKGEPLNAKDRAGGCERMSHLATDHRIGEDWFESNKPQCRRG